MITEQFNYSFSFEMKSFRSSVTSSLSASDFMLL